ncbi:glycosyltransferase family 4 protein [Aestuariivivens sediminicola]|uniref:glycosyltransferase family 4 protein n=1 Tax=Aestuariivivens sediminicola TaxID=2913560 RepID=UPI001F5A2FDB|nr:glycosyltransferase family 4 protein [Aestuariivivens sediminicola]
MKIAVIVSKFPALTETFIVNQLVFLKSSGHTVHIYAQKLDTENAYINPLIERYNLLVDAQELNWRNFMPYNKWQRYVHIWRTLMHSSSLFWALLKSLNIFIYGLSALNGNQFFRTKYLNHFALEKYDVVHVHFANNALNIIEMLNNFQNKKVVSFHGYDAHRFDASFYKPLREISDISYVVNTKYTRDKVVKLGFNTSRISIIPVGVDSSFFISRKRTNMSINVLFVGRLIKLKAPLFSIKIIEKLIKQYNFQVYFNIIGDGKEYDKCFRYITENNLEKFVHLLGEKAPDEVKNYMNSSDIFLFPGICNENGRCEAQGLVIQEAQSMELPVVISDAGGMSEGIINGKTGFVVNEKDLDGFVDRIIFLIQNPEKRKEMGKAGRLFVVKHYDNEILGNKLLELYTH